MIWFHLVYGRTRRSVPIMDGNSSSCSEEFKRRDFATLRDRAEMDTSQRFVS